MKKTILKHKTASFVFIGFLLLVILFAVWNLVEKRKAEAAAKRTNDNSAVVSKEKTVNSYREAVDIDPRDYPAWNNLCRIYIKKEEYEKAVQAFLKLVEIKPGDPSVFDDVEGAGLKEEKYDNLIAFYSRLLKKRPGDYYTWYKAGEIYRTLKQDYNRAIRAFIKAFEINPNSKEVLNALGWCYYITGDLKTSGRIYNKASRLDVNYFKEWNANAWLDLGTTYEEKKKYDKAIDAYKKAIRINPKYHRSWKRLAEVYQYKKNNPGKAIDTCKRAIKMDPRNFRAWHNLGEIYFNNVDFDKAIYAFKRATRVEPGAFDSWLRLGHVYWNKGELINAVKNFSKAVEINPALWDAWRSLGTIYLTKKQYDEAIHAFRAMTGIKSKRTGMETSVSWLFLGDAYHKKRRYKKAIDAYKKSIETSPDFSLPRENIIRTYINAERFHEAVLAFLEFNEIKKNGQLGLDEIDAIFVKQEAFDQAVTFYKILLEKTPGDYQAWCRLGNIYSLYKKNYQEALMAFYKASKIKADSTCALDGLGWTYHLIGKYGKSMDIYKKAIQAAPGSALEWKSKISYNLAIKHSKKGQYDEAIDAFKESIALFPTFNLAWHKLADEYQKKKGEEVIYSGEPWDFHFNNADLRQVIIFIARQTGLSFIIDQEVRGKITCQLDRVQWDKALDLFLKINDCDMCGIGNIRRIGKSEVIENYIKKRGVKDIKSFIGKPLDLLFSGDDINFVLQTLAAKLKLRIIVDPGINHHITCEFFQVPWDLALDVILEENDLMRFQLGTLLRVGSRADIKKMCESEEEFLELIQSLLQLDPRQVNSRDANGRTILFTAAKRGYAKLVRHLISLGADVRARDRWKFTPLHEAGTREVAEILIARGANLHAWSKTGATPLQAAVFDLRTGVARFLAEKGAKTDIFLEAAMGRLAQVREIMEKYPRLVNKAETDGWTPLHHAAAAGQYRTAVFLISWGADVNAVSQKGETPLHVAVSRGKEKVVKLLVKKGAHVNTRDKYGHTPFNIAKTNGYKKIARFLQRHRDKD